ncbi:helix-turn-helix domain-containing protein [Nonomuraea sp. NPDC050643]|uniref:winged helix-turn-helix domain-containing protein n=1 Tax=Nonomuraea sp. NPDC050643 TaxID=3155660 RepID=UPI0033D1E53B
MGVLHEMRHKAEDASTPGTVGYVGAAFLPDGDYLWAREHQLTELLPADWMPAAGILESLGSPPRLTLLGTLVRHGRRTRADLQEALGGDGAETTSGQLYHHLRALQNAGLIVQRRRGEYELAAVAVIPLLTIVATALNLATDPPIGPPIGPPIEE